MSFVTFFSLSRVLINHLIRLTYGDLYITISCLTIPLYQTNESKRKSITLAVESCKEAA